MNLKATLIIILACCAASLYSCEEPKGTISNNPTDWDLRAVSLEGKDSLSTGKTYLSVYSEIYSRSEARKISLTSTINMRNINITDTIYIASAKFYSTEGDLLKDYFSSPIYLAPLETAKIVLGGPDIVGGSGANFVFEWYTKPQSNEPLFEGVMVSTEFQLGLSFTTLGLRI